jgi:hypothetical protein
MAEHSNALRESIHYRAEAVEADMEFLSAYYSVGVSFEGHATVMCHCRYGM